MTTSTLPLREQIADFVRRELVGPDPQPSSAQANGEEILIGDAPRMRYGAGVLFPQTALIDDVIIAAPEEINDEPAETDGDEAPTLERRENNAHAAKDSIDADEPDEMVSLANAFLPSAMGFSCVVEIGERGLIARINAATYAARDVKQIGKDGREFSRRHYDRKPLEATVELPAAELLGDGIKTPRFDVAGEKLCVRVLSRPFGDEPNLRLLTLALVNTQQGTSGERIKDEQCYFQVEMKLTAADESAAFREYPDSTLQPDEEECSLALLYRHRKTYAIGHGCAANWHQTDEENGRADAVWCDVLPLHEIKPIVPNVFDDLPLSMLDLSDRGDDAKLDALLDGLCDRYEKWIGDQHSAIDQLSGNMEAAARRHLEKCFECLGRMRGGAALLRNDDEVRRAFRLANRAMLQQQLHYALGTDDKLKRSWSYANDSWQIKKVAWPDINNPGTKGKWYPFQLAFLLMNLRSLAIEDDPERGIVDLIWFPTGGGKTEAYLGLTAFTIILRRLRHPDDAGTSVLMRYTLRLLTAQQFQRASSLICALEKMRTDGDIAGVARISAGLWAGKGLTPNKRDEARSALNQLETAQRGASKDNPFVMPVCPWCGAEMGRVESNGQSRVQGYEEQTQGGSRTVVFRCPDDDCDFGGRNTLPLCVIDEDLYLNAPTLLLGTVDKFAMLTWRPEARAFFGLDDGQLAPDLIIQDELHLISGPLGSMVGHYETVINELCARYDEDGKRIGPKIVASTATISRAGEQCHGLWNCGAENVFQFPPQLLRAGDSFFAYEDEKRAGRLYLGVHASALSSHVTAQIRVMAALLQAPLCANVSDIAERDPYWTLIGYYNSLRELGHAATLLGADIREYLNAMWLRLGIEKPVDETQPELRRFINRDLELTSRIPSGQIPDLLQQLFITYSGDRERERPIDVALATNMISVGVDVPRLGLMTVAGQPKTTSEYIQATSRVGRDKPGLVVTIYNTGKPRDRSHYEHFHSYHGAVYRAVEPTSVTPFSSPVRDRALHAIVATLVRYLGTEANRERPSPSPDDDLWNRIEEIIERRVEGVDESERDATMEQLNDEINHWMNISPPRYGGWSGPDEDVPLLYPAGSVPLPVWESKSWATPSSMRDVDASCDAQVLGHYPQPPTESQGATARPDNDTESGESNA